MGTSDVVEQLNDEELTDEESAGGNRRMKNRSYRNVKWKSRTSDNGERIPSKHFNSTRAEKFMYV